LFSASLERSLASAAGETIGAVVGDADGVIVVLERDHCSKAAFGHVCPVPGRR
jgi:hypothetical protein